MPISPPSLSIVIPTLNEATRLPQLLTQLAGAQQRSVDIVIVDGGSTDATVRIAEAAGVRVISSATGRAHQLQAGIDATTSDALWLLHADSDIDPAADQHIIWALSNTLRFWGHFSVRIDGHSPLLWLVAIMMNLRARLTGIATGDQGLFMQREALERVGGIPLQPIMEDVELSKRLRTLCPPIGLLKRVTTSGRRWEHHGVLRTILLMWRLRFAYWRGQDPAELAQRYRASDDRRNPIISV